MGGCLRAKKAAAQRRPLVVDAGEHSSFGLGRMGMASMTTALSAKADAMPVGGDRIAVSAVFLPHNVSAGNARCGGEDVRPETGNIRRGCVDAVDPTVSALDRQRFATAISRRCCLSSRS